MQVVIRNAALLGCSLASLAASAATSAAVTELAAVETPARAGSIVFAKTGRLIAADCADSKLRVWSVPDGRLQREIDVSGRDVDVLVISDNGKEIAIGDHGGGYTIWDTLTGATLVQVRMAFYPAAMVFSHDGGTLAIAPTGDPVELIDTASGKKRLELQRPLGGTAAIAFSRDDRLVATGDADTVVRVYDAGSGALQAQNADFLLEPLAIDFSVDGRQLIAGGADRLVAAVDTRTGNVLRKSAKVIDPIAYLEVSTDGRLLAAALMHGADLTQPAPLLISEMASGRIVQEWTPGDRVRGGTWTTDGRLLVATTSGNVLHVWRVR
jgi:WD40 repeat protein